MKEYIFLVDVADCHFLTIKENNHWELPTIQYNNKITNIENQFYNKYKINIRNIELIYSEHDYILMKCKTDDISFDKTKCEFDVIKEIYSKITNKKHKKLLFKIMIKIQYEVINDSFWLGVILSVEDKIDNNIIKSLLSDFLLHFSSSFCEELCNYKYAGVLDHYEKNIIRQIKNMRNYYFKECPLYDSKNIKKIIKEMGINFDNYTFDHILFFTNNQLIDINSRLWNEVNIAPNDLFYKVVLSPRKWIGNLMPQVNDIFENTREKYVNGFYNKFKKIKIKYKSYSTNKLFCNSNLTNSEKIYIMQRIGLLKISLFLSDVLGNDNYFIINENYNIMISLDIFLMKVKAAIIETIWNDSKTNNLPFLKKIVENYPKDIVDDFFSINRKCRNKWHYGFFNELTDDDLCILRKYQDVYLIYMICEFEKNLTIHFGLKYRIGLLCAKIKYWSDNK